MRKIAFLLSLLMLCLVAAPAQAAKKSQGIAAVVNNVAITQADLNDRVKMIASSANLPQNADVMARVRPQVLSTLIEEQIKLQEAARLKIKIDETDIDQAMAEIAGQNKMTPDQFRQMFKTRGLPIKSLRAQIRAQLAWMRVVTREIRPDIEVSETDIDAELSMMQAKVGQDEFRLAEIVLPIDRPQDEKNAGELAARLVAKIKKEPGDFPVLAQQFSRAAGAATGGDIGWVAVDQVAAEIAPQLATSKSGTLIGPYKTPSGLHIVLVRDRRARAAENLPGRDAIANRIGMERLDRLQRRYYLDLRSTSFIDVRL